jgi:hypothetical protein
MKCNFLDMAGTPFFVPHLLFFTEGASSNKTDYCAYLSVIFTVFLYMNMLFIFCLEHNLFTVDTEIYPCSGDHLFTWQEHCLKDEQCLDS